MSKKLYALKGKKDGHDYEIVADDVKALQKVLTRFLRDGGSGMIWRFEDSE